MDKVDSTGNAFPADPTQEGSMPIKLSPKKSVGEKPAPSEAEHKSATADRRCAHAKAKPAPKAKRLPAATIRALSELEAGELTRHDNADDLFRKLGIKRDKA
jgi:hypothetical protein